MLRKLFGVVALLGLFLTPAEAILISSNVIQNTTAVEAMLLRPKESLSYTLTGTATGQIQIEKSTNGSVWEPAGFPLTAAGPISTRSGTIYAGEQDTLYRWRCSTITAVTGGTFTVHMADNDDSVGEWRNNKGAPVLRLFDDSLRFSNILNFNPGNIITLSSTTVLNRENLSRTYNVFTSTGGQLLMGNLPTISTTYAVVGDVYVLQSSTASIIFSDNDTVAGTLLELGSTSRAIGVGDILILIYRAGKFWEMGFFNN